MACPRWATTETSRHGCSEYPIAPSSTFDYVGAVIAVMIRLEKLRMLMAEWLYYMTEHDFPSWASAGFWDFSICPIRSSKALETFSLYLALASVHPHWYFSDSLLPSSAVTWRCSGRRSLLFPTITIGTVSVPCSIVSTEQGKRGPHLPLSPLLWFQSGRLCNTESLPSGLVSYPWWPAPSQRMAMTPQSKPTCIHEYRWSASNLICYIHPVIMVPESASREVI